MFKERVLQLSRALTIFCVSSRYKTITEELNKMRNERSKFTQWK